MISFPEDMDFSIRGWEGTFLSPCAWITYAFPCSGEDRPVSQSRYLHQSQSNPSPGLLKVLMLQCHPEPPICSGYLVESKAEPVTTGSTAGCLSLLTKWAGIGASMLAPQPCPACACPRQEAKATLHLGAWSHQRGYFVLLCTRILCPRTGALPGFLGDFSPCRTLSMGS